MAVDRHRTTRAPAEGAKRIHPLLQSLQSGEENVAERLDRIASGGDAAEEMQQLERVVFPWLAVLEDVVLPHAAATLKSDAHESVSAAFIRVDVIDALMPRGRAAEGDPERRAWCRIVRGELSALGEEIRNIARQIPKGDLDALQRSAATLQKEIGEQFQI